MGEKELAAKLEKANEFNRNQENVYKDKLAELEEKIKLAANQNNESKHIKELQAEIDDKNKLLVKFAQSVESTNKPRPRRQKLKEKYGIKYENKYTSKQILAFEKAGVSTGNMAKEELPNVDHIKTN